MPSIVDLCRELRKRQTPAEEFLWQHLRNRKLYNKKFLRQHPICVSSAFGKNVYCLPEFYCYQPKLIIEDVREVHPSRKKLLQTWPPCWGLFLLPFGVTAVRLLWYCWCR